MQHTTVVTLTTAWIHEKVLMWEVAYTGEQQLNLLDSRHSTTLH